LLIQRVIPEPEIVAPYVVSVPLGVAPTFSWH
jgi:hypothetical protein